MPLSFVQPCYSDLFVPSYKVLQFFLTSAYLSNKKEERKKNSDVFD